MNNTMNTMDTMDTMDTMNMVNTKMIGRVKNQKRFNAVYA